MKRKKPTPPPPSTLAIEAKNKSPDGESAANLASKDSVGTLAASLFTPKGIAMVGLLPESGAARSMLDAGAHNGLKEIDILSQLLKDSQLPDDQRLASWERLAESQAKTLDCLFHRLVALGFANIQKDHFQPLLKLAFRAQAQSARTLETLATLRHPAVFAKQVNIGQQQVVANGVSFQGAGGGPAAAAGHGSAPLANGDPESPALAADRECLDDLTDVTRGIVVP
jgi:hypothetical protein